MYRGRALARPVSELVALAAGGFALVVLLVLYLWAAGLGLGGAR